MLRAEDKFVVKCRGKYCKFESYGQCTLKYEPVSATLYRRKSEAIKRAERDHYIHHKGIGYVATDPDSFSVHKLALYYEEIAV